jgi:hypothetical protein
MNNDLSLVIKNYSNEKDRKNPSPATLDIKTIGIGIQLKNIIMEELP